jgi:hypothetical protein
MASECLLDIRSIGYGLAVGMVGEVRPAANGGQCVGNLTPAGWLLTTKDSNPIHERHHDYARYPHLRVYYSISGGTADHC